MAGLHCRCGREVNGTTLCARCVHTIKVALTNIPAYLADLELVETRRKGIRYDLPRGKGGSKSLPLVVDARFLPGGTGSLATVATRRAVVTWVRRCLKQWPNAADRPTDSVASCCAYLTRMLPRIAVVHWGGDLMDAILSAEKALLRVDARGPERIYAGLCTICLIGYDRTPLYAYPGDEYVTCTAADCGMTYRVEERRTLMADALEYEWMTAAKIADLAAYLQLLGGREWVRKKLNRWHSDGLLTAADTNDKGEPRFPFGEASRLLIAADSTRRTNTGGHR